MKNIENHTVYFDDNNIKTLYKASLAFKILRKNMSSAFDSPKDYVIELPVANLTTDDLKIEVNENKIAISPKTKIPKFNIKKVFKLPNNVDALNMSVSLDNGLLTLKFKKNNTNINLS
jgi:HSP20 family molecular chaperone IbpA